MVFRDVPEMPISPSHREDGSKDTTRLSPNSYCWNNSGDVMMDKGDVVDLRCRLPGVRSCVATGQLGPIFVFQATFSVLSHSLLKQE